jgi:hypothetical protein
MVAALLLVAAHRVVVPAHAATVASPRCFGAASRDPLHPCNNPKLRLLVTPTPDKALLTPNLACALTDAQTAIEQCSYGVPPDQAVETVALLGDSHASHWRAAMESVALAKKWRVLEFAVPHCPFSFAMPDAGQAVADFCPGWNQTVIQFLGANPQINTVVMSANSRDPLIVPDGQTRYDTRVNGFVDAMQSLPGSVQHIIVLRDDPIDRLNTFQCIRSAIAHHKPAGLACPVPRTFAMTGDAEVTAAQQLTARGAAVIDLTPQFCTAHVCYPVVGGVLVHKDANHLSQRFSGTLGPFLLRGINAVLAGASRATT